MRYPVGAGFVVMLPLTIAVACDMPVAPANKSASPFAAESATSAANEKLLAPELCAFTRNDFTLSSANDYFPLSVGSEWVYSGEEDGELVELRISISDQTEAVGGVTTRVVEEREWVAGELLEFSRNFVVATGEGTICYFGEDVDIYEEGGISHAGAWRADAAGNAPGILMPPDPRPGMMFTMEGAPGLAEDAGRIVGGGPARTPAGEFRETIRVRESNPLDGTFGFKSYAKGVGLVIDAPVSLQSYVLTANGQE